MYGRIISFTLLAPSLWTVVEAIGSIKNDNNHKIKILHDKLGKIAGLKLETIKAMRGLREQAMAKVNVSEGEGLGG